MLDSAPKYKVHRMFEPDDILDLLSGLLAGLTQASGQCGHWMVNQICEEFGCEDASAILLKRKTMPPLCEARPQEVQNFPVHLAEMPYMHRVAALGGVPVRAWYNPRIMRVFVEGPTGRRFSLRAAECSTFVGQAHLKALRALYGSEHAVVHQAA